jgi:hypothetical protein
MVDVQKRYDELAQTIKLPRLTDEYSLVEFNPTMPISICAFCLFAGDYAEYPDK